MKKIKFLFIITALLSRQSIVSAQSLAMNKWNDLIGSVDYKEFQVSLFPFADSTVKGSWCFLGGSTRRLLTGSISNSIITVRGDDGIRFRISFKNISEEYSDKFECQYVDKIDGMIDNPQPVTLTLSAVGDGTFKHRYLQFPQSDQVVEEFATKVKNAMMTDDKQWLAKSLHYPISCEEEDGEFVTVRTSSQFLTEYSKIVTPALKRALKSCSTVNMKYGFEGVTIFANNVDYIHLLYYKEPVTKKMTLIISGINHG